MFTPFRISSTLGRAMNVDLDDTFLAKKALNRLGYYKAPKHGLTRYPDERLFSSIKSFQVDQGLKGDGIVKPDGPTASKLAEVLSGQMAPKVSKPASLNLGAMVGSGKQNAAKDVVSAKRALAWAGHYPAAKAQSSDANLDRDFVSGLLDFQRSSGLKTDGWMGPDGETRAALDKDITPRIARHFQTMLKSAFAAKGEEDGDEKSGEPTEPQQPDEPKEPKPPEEPDKPDEPTEPDEPDGPDEEDCDEIETELAEAEDYLADIEHQENGIQSRETEIIQKIYALYEEAQQHQQSLLGSKVHEFGWRWHPGLRRTRKVIGPDKKDLESSREEMRRRIAEIKQEVSRLHEELKELEKEKKSIEAEIEEAGAIVEDIKQALEECQAKNEK